MVAVTVLIPVYEVPLAMLNRAIGSVLAQTFAELELLIVDDGSPKEQVRAQLDRWAAADERVRVLHEPHRGVPGTLNRGLEAARGEWIARQDADDWSEPERIERQLAFLEKHSGVALVGTGTYSHCADGAPLWRFRLPHAPGELRRALWQKNPFVHGSTMYRRATALAVGGYRAEFPCSSDYDFLWRVAETGDAVNLKEVLYHYRYTGGSISARRAVDQARVHRAAQLLAAARKRGEAEDVRGALEEADRQAFSRAFRASLKQADHLMLAGDFRGASCAYLRLLQSQPSSGLAWAKIARLAVFAAIPPAREVCFR